MSLGDQLDNLLLARGERILRYALAAPCPLKVVPDQCGDRRWIKERLAAHRGPDRLNEITVGRRFEHVPGSAGLERLEEVLLVVVHREDQHSQVGAAAVKLGHSL